MRSRQEGNTLERDLWLSEMLGREVYRLSITGKEDPGHGLKELLSGTMGRKGVFIYTKVPASSMAMVRFLEDAGFRVVDTNVVLEKPPAFLNKLAGQSKIRFARPEDEEAVSQLAGNSFKYSRFHLDDNFTKETADKIKAEWARNFFRGKRGSAMVVSEAKGKIAGFLQLIQGHDGTLTIDLIAVDKEERRKGIARDMIAFAQNECNEVNTIRVGTQAANAVSLRCYEDMGFRFTGASYVLHYHNK